MKITPKDVSIRELHSYLLGSVVPRPIAFASTIDKQGNPNLSPFSYFNVFSANPPILIFSPANRARDNTQKHTLENVLEVPEATINMVSHTIVEQMSLASTEYDRGVNEFVKAGLTPIESESVAPPRVGESPISFECQVIEVKRLGDEGGAGNLVICEIALIHIADEILDGGKKIDPYKLDAVARMGGNYYARVQGNSIFEIPKPLSTKGIGVDKLPKAIRESTVLTGNNLGRLGNVEHLPSKESVNAYKSGSSLDDFTIDAVHVKAKELLEEGNVEEAWMVLLQSEDKW